MPVIMPAEAPFDPCRQWLGIDAVDLGDASRVLGVNRDERDPSAVLRAAEARLSHLRSLSPGPFERARAGLIARVEEARAKMLKEIATGDQTISPIPRFSMPPPPSSIPIKPPPHTESAVHRMVFDDTQWPSTGGAAPPAPVSPPRPWAADRTSYGDNIPIIKIAKRQESPPVNKIATACLFFLSMMLGAGFFPGQLNTLRSVRHGSNCSAKLSPCHSHPRPEPILQ